MIDKSLPYVTKYLDMYLGFKTDGRSVPIQILIMIHTRNMPWNNQWSVTICEQKFLSKVNTFYIKTILQHVFEKSYRLKGHSKSLICVKNIFQRKWVQFYFGKYKTLVLFISICFAKQFMQILNMYVAWLCAFGGTTCIP